MTDHREKLRSIKTFPSLVKFLRDELDWPVETDDFEELTFDYMPEELGIDAASAAKIQDIKRLRPLAHSQPWGIFFVKFEPKQLPVVALRRILNGVVVKKRATSSSAEQQKWTTEDLLFISAYGEDTERRISFAHFSQSPAAAELATLKVLAWDEQDTGLHLDNVASRLVEYLSWPAEEDEWDDETWRDRWTAAFELRHREVVTTSKALAIHLADLARAARMRINEVLQIENEDGPVTGLMTAFREALIHDLEPDDFADMYAQTIAYGLLSARIANPSGLHGSPARLPVTNPFLKELMETFLHVGGPTRRSIDFDEIGVTDVIELLDDANMEAVILDFGDENPLEDPVIHFYELFLKEYDAKKRMQRGVFYTPRPVVSYIVRSVDELLKTEFGLEYGLADTATWDQVAERLGVECPQGVDEDDRFVTVLDPATGTGTFLVEAIDVIHQTLVEKWTKAGCSESEVQGLWNEYVPSHLLPRLHGYELMMAPYAIAHLKIGLKLFETGYRFESDERARIYLTNALEPAQQFSDQLEFVVPALAHEAHAVNAIKERQRFTVVIGNPPYSIHSGNLAPTARALVDRYRSYEGERIRERGALQFEKNLQNDYVKFVRVGEMLVEGSEVGVLGLITSHAYLTNRTLRGMRESLLATFDLLRVLNLHGNAASGEAAVLATDDENVFEIVEGVAIMLATRNIGSTNRARTEYAEIAGPRGLKYELLAGRDDPAAAFEVFDPPPPALLFKPRRGGPSAFYTGHPVDQVFRQYSAGVITARDRFATDTDKDALIDRAESFARAPETGADLLDRFAISPKRGWDVDVAKAQAAAGMPLREAVKPYLYRPFDSRYIAYNRGIVWGMAYPTLRHTLRGGNRVLIAMKQYQYDVPDYCYVFVSGGLTDSRIFVSKTGVATLFPLYLNPADDELPDGPRDSNLTTDFRDLFVETAGLEWLNEGVGDVAEGTIGPDGVLNYIYAQLHTPSYRERFSEELRTDWPRIFFARDEELLRELVRIGGELIALHLMERTPDAGDTARYVGAASTPRVGRARHEDGVVWLDETRGNGFANVSEDVWQFFIGGYKVSAKWLKDRRGNVLTAAEVSHYETVIGVIASTIRRMRTLDGIVRAHGGWDDAFVAPDLELAR